MNTKIVVIIVVLCVLIGAGGFYLGQSNKGIPAEQIEETPPEGVGLEENALPTVTSTPIPSHTPTHSAGSGQAVDDTAALIAMVKASEVARYGPDANALTYSVSQINGNFARGMAGGTGGGAIWFAAKVNGTWKLVFIGNGTVQCSQLIDYPNFPNTMIPSCWDAVNQKNVIR